MTAQRAPGEREENETEKGLRISDRGFLNTAVIRSQITFIDGEAGGVLALGIKIEPLLRYLYQSCGTGAWISCHFTPPHLASNDSWPEGTQLSNSRSIHLI